MSSSNRLRRLRRSKALPNPSLRPPRKISLRMDKKSSIGHAR
jgi:hypothetical protein